MKLPWVSRAYLQERLDAVGSAVTAELTAAIESARHCRDRAEVAEARALRADELLDAIRAERIAEREAFERRAERDMVRAETRYADLLASYRMLRLQGHAEPTPVPVPLPAEKPDPVLAAINAKAPDARTRKAMLVQVAIDRGAGLEDQEIVERIHRGTRPAEEIA